MGSVLELHAKVDTNKSETDVFKLAVLLALNLVTEDADQLPALKVLHSKAESAPRLSVEKTKPW